MSLMKVVRIISIPDGEALEWVRVKWIGLEFPLLGEAETSFGILTDNQTDGEYWVVNSDDALSVLNAHSPEARKWWLNNYFLPEGLPHDFLFNKNSCEVIEVEG